MNGFKEKRLKGLKEFNEWCHNHPHIYAFLIAFLLISSTFIKSDLVWVGLSVAVVGAVLAYHMRTLIVLVLAFSLACQPLEAGHYGRIMPPETRSPAGVIIGVTVLVGGTYVVVKLWRKCQQWFGPKSPQTNSTPDDAISGVYSHGAPGSCVVLGEPLPVATHVNIEVKGSSVELKVIPQDQLISAAEFSNNLGGWGLPDVGYFTSEAIDMSLQSVSYRDGGQTRTIRIQHSENLIDWEEVISVELPIDKILLLEDLSFAPASYWRAQ